MAELTAKALVIHPRPKEMQIESGARRGSLWMILASHKGGYESRPEFIKEAVRKRLEEIKALAK